MTLTASEVNHVLKSLRIEPESAFIDQWLADTARWSSERPNTWLNSGGASWLDTIVEGLSQASR